MGDRSRRNASGRCGFEQPVPENSYFRYGPGIEVVEPGEPALFRRIADVMIRAREVTERRYDRPVRASHLKALGLLRATLSVPADLSPELAQGLFARAGEYDAVIRLSHVPAEFLDDRGASCPRGMAIKVFGVDGERLPGHEGATQDFVLDTGEAFNMPNAHAFLAAITGTEVATFLPEGVKSAVSAVSRAANDALHMIGTDSLNLDFYGHPRLHPLGERYYSQAPLRWGEYVAKLAAFPAVAPPADAELPDTPDGLREAVAAWLAARPAEYAIAAQLCTDLARMPVENAHAVWPEQDSPYREVARLRIPAQSAWTEAREHAADALSFTPWHGLEAHRPLGQIMRARRYAYDALARARGAGGAEPASAEAALPSRT
jgi:hypothetical protein